MERKPKKGKEDKKRERKVGAVEEEGTEFITQIKQRDDLTLDYS